MTGMLASVNSVDEALMVLDAQVDIIDLKQPASGALGALDFDTVNEIVAVINGRCPVSATIGDLPMQPELIFNAVTIMAETGVDYIKIGFFPGGDWTGTLAKLARLKEKNLKLIAVLFADTQPDFSVSSALKNAGFTGVMLDTMNKAQGSLTEVMDKQMIEQFVIHAKELQLVCGLAGSLRIKDINKLMAYQVDYLGFRGALCEQHNRVGQLSNKAIIEVQQAIHVKTDG